MLAIHLPHVQRLISFTDRPYRKVKTLTVEQLAAGWGAGCHSFGSNPPNAAITSDNLDTAVIAELANLKINDDTVEFNVNILQASDNVEKFELNGQVLPNVSLFIDGHSCSCEAMCGGAEATCKDCGNCGYCPNGCTS